MEDDETEERPESVAVVSDVAAAAAGGDGLDGATGKRKKEFNVVDGGSGSLLRPVCWVGQLCAAGERLGYG